LSRSPHTATTTVVDLRPDHAVFSSGFLVIIWRHGVEPLTAAECGVHRGHYRLARALPRAGPRPDPWADQDQTGPPAFVGEGLLWLISLGEMSSWMTSLSGT
jgi:hypothetical protein